MAKLRLRGRRVELLPVPADDVMVDVLVRCRRCLRWDRLALALRWNYCLNCSTTSRELWIVIGRLPCGMVLVRETGMRRGDNA